MAIQPWLQRSWLKSALGGTVVFFFRCGLHFFELMPESETMQILRQAKALALEFWQYSSAQWNKHIRYTASLVTVFLNPSIVAANCCTGHVWIIPCPILFKPCRMASSKLTVYDVILGSVMLENQHQQTSRPGLEVSWTLACRPSQRRRRRPWSNMAERMAVSARRREDMPFKQKIGSCD